MLSASQSTTPFHSVLARCTPSRQGCNREERKRHLSLLLLSLLGKDRGVGVQAQHDLLVAQRVLLLHSGAAGDGLALGGVEGALDFGAVDEAGEIGLRDDVGRQQEVALVGRGLGGGAVDLVEGLEGSGGPDDEAAQVTTGSQLEQVQGGDGAGLDTGDVAESADEVLAIDGGVVDDERTTALAVAAATELALTGTELLGALDLLDIGTGADSLEESQRAGGLGGGTSLEDGRVDDEGNLGNGHDLVATGHQERGGSRSSQGGAGSVAPEFFMLVSPPTFRRDKLRLHSLLALVDLDVPLAPDLGGSEHAAGTAHVTEGGLTGTVSTTTGDTGDTGDGTT